jgi:beta-mannosidase
MRYSLYCTNTLSVSHGVRELVRRMCICAVVVCAQWMLFSCTEQRLELTDDAVTLAISVDSASPPFLDLRGSWRFWRDSTAYIHNNGSMNMNLGKNMGIAMDCVAVPANWEANGIHHAGSAWYERRFFLPSEGNDTEGKDTMLRLVFEGVDYAADVWLNGQYCGSHEGYFSAFAFDVSAYLKRGNEPNNVNILRVRVHSPNEQDVRRVGDWSLHKRLVKGIFSHHDTRPGGAWSQRGQEMNTGGIWGNVYLSASRRVAIERVSIMPLLNAAFDTAVVRIHSRIWSNATKPVRTRVVWNIGTKSGAKSPTKSGTKSAMPFRVETFATLHHGSNFVEGSIIIAKPHLWYSHDVADSGLPAMYRITTTVVDADDRLSKNNAQTADDVPLYHTFSELDTREDAFGIRSVEFNTAKGEWLLNGKRLFLRGTNYIGTQLLSTMNRSAYDTDVRLMTEANVNAVRVHAHVARREFYEACDSAGVLVWQDFPLQWGYADDAEFVRSASAQVLAMIRTLENHPSIIAWSLQNEPPFDADWMKYKYTDYSPMQNRSLNVVLTRLARHLDSTRYCHAFSATREHHWEGWYFGSWLDYAKPVPDALITEFGAQGLPAMETLAGIVGSNRTFPRSDEDWAVWEYHNVQRKETVEFAKVQMGTDAEDFIRNSQEHQAETVRLAAESYRLQRYAPVGAMFQFMLVESWASANWGIVDYRRHPKPAYGALKAAYAPILLTVDFDALSQMYRLWLVNDSWKSYPQVEVRYTISASSLTSSSFSSSVSSPTSRRFSLGADSSLVVAQIPAIAGRKEFSMFAVCLAQNGDTLALRRGRIRLVANGSQSVAVYSP